MRRELHARGRSLNQVECARHGKVNGALVCRHLMRGRERGFHYFAERAADCIECPDAWCDACHEVLAGADDWTDEFAGHAKFKVVCSHCYARIRAKNWVQDEEAWRKLLTSSFEYLQARQQSFGADFRIDEHPRWDWNQERAELVFSREGRPVVICDITFVGTLSRRTRTWLWSWANSSLLDAVKAPMLEVRDLGEQRNFERLAGALWPADEVDGWEMTAIAARYFGAIGSYRTPDENGFSYLLITGARWAA
jgi:hypothetical protein